MDRADPDNADRVAQEEVLAASAHRPPPLTAEQVGLVRAWIDQGAK